MNEAGESQSRLFPRRVGERLAETRQEQQIELADIAARTRIPLRHLIAIEASNYAALPAATYSTGFVRTYAQLLGLDGSEYGRQYREEIGVRPASRHTAEPFEPADPARVPTRLLALVALVIALLLAGGYAFWRGGWFSGESPDDRAQLAAGTLPEEESSAPPASGGTIPTIAAPAPAAATAAGPVTLAAAGGPVWLKIYERSGRTLFMGELGPGERYIVPGDAVDPLLLTGRPHMLRVTIGDREMPPLGTAEQTIADISLKAAALLAPRAMAGTGPALAPAAAPAPRTIP